ncbi:MAG: FAD-dependent oxidoreductase, partial [Spirosomaceae bacterium]|nr:FAD-dependent oxidoreductase [Spirosomataceae bacterium]
MFYDVIIIGGGIVGLATALSLKEQNPNIRVILIEKENEVAAHQTGNNSGVIHSGLYYKPGSLKAKNCIEGYQKLLDFCNQEEIPYEFCGKIVVATQKEQIPILDGLFERGQQNGLDNLKLLNVEEMREIEPHVKGLKAIKVPQTGIINYKLVSQKMADKIQKLGAEIRLGERVSSISKVAN